MPEVNRKLEVTFSKDEIKAILAKHARALVLTRKDVACVELEQVQHVEGEATVTLIVGNKPVEVPLRDRLINAREKMIAEVHKLTAYIEGEPMPKNLFRKSRPWGH